MGLENLSKADQTFIGAMSEGISSIASTASSAISQMKANSAAMKSAKAEAQLLREDAAYQAQQELKSAKRLRSAQIAAYISSGISLEGSPLLVTQETTQEAAKNANQITKTAAYKSDAILNNAKAKQKSISYTDIFNTGSDMLTAYSKWQKAGGTKSKD